MSIFSAKCIFGFCQYFLFQLLEQRILTFWLWLRKKIFLQDDRDLIPVFKILSNISTIALMFKRMIIIKIFKQNASNIN